MYYQHYGFKEPPFNLTPDSRFFYASQKHLEALNTLVYAITERKGFVVISGEIGSGKTTTCRTLLNRLEPSTKTALITNTHLTAKDLLMTILDDLDVEYSSGSKSKLLSQLNSFLIEQLNNDNNVVLIVDEAQNLTPSVLEEIRMLSNLETENEKLIQIILMGQPELKEKLRMARLEQLRQRIAFFYHLKPLSFDETMEYVLHRLKIASSSGRKYFTDEALKLIAKWGRGTPRIINQICDSALLSGFTYNYETINEQVVMDVIKELPMNIIGEEKAKKESMAIDHSEDHDLFFGQFPETSFPNKKDSNPEKRIGSLN